MQGAVGAAVHGGQCKKQLCALCWTPLSLHPHVHSAHSTRASSPLPRPTTLQWVVYLEPEDAKYSHWTPEECSSR